MKTIFEGLRVLDITNLFAGPYASVYMADMGAEVIHIERPKVGDDMRSYTPKLDGDMKTPCVSFLVGNIHHYDMGMLLDRLGIAVRTGHHCAQPLMQRLGIEGAIRASFSFYNTHDEVDVFIDGLKRVIQML